MGKIRVASIAEIAEGKPVIVAVNGIELGIFLVEDCYFAWRNVCPHAAAPVCFGTVHGTKLPSSVYEYRFGCENQILRCPWHGWEFDLRTGKHLAGPMRLKGYEVEVDESDVYVVIP